MWMQNKCGTVGIAAFMANCSEWYKYSSVYSNSLTGSLIHHHQRHLWRKNRLGVHLPVCDLDLACMKCDHLQMSLDTILASSSYPEGQACCAWAQMMQPSWQPHLQSWITFWYPSELVFLIRLGEKNAPHVQHAWFPMHHNRLHHSNLPTIMKVLSFVHLWDKQVHLWSSAFHFQHHTLDSSDDNWGDGTIFDHARSQIWFHFDYWIATDVLCNKRVGPVFLNPLVSFSNERSIL